MRRLNITAVCYLNTLPFVFGLSRASQRLDANLLLATPVGCTQNFLENKADIALIPAADLRLLDSECKIITDYCIGANDFVRTVVIVSDCPIEEIETIFLDSHSHTSVELVKILAKEYWQISPRYETITVSNLKKEDKCGYLLIGDKVFEYEEKFKHSYDLAHFWKLHTSLPFVFAVWVARSGVDSLVIEELNNALRFGVKNIEDAVCSSNFKGSKERNIDYLINNIDFVFDSTKRVALNKFLQKVPPSSAI